MALERRRRGEVTKYFAPQIQLDFKPPHDTAVSEILKALSKFVANNPRIDERRSIRPWLKSDAAKRWISEVLIEYISVERGIWTPLYAVPTDATGFDLDAGLRAVELLLARGADVGRSQRSRSSGLHFSLGVRLNGAKKSSALETASRRQAIFRSKKRDPLHSLLDHQEPYKPYTEVKSSAVRSCLIKIAHSFLELDRLFAAMFVQVIERQTTDPGGDAARDSYIGNLGQHCEDLLEYYERARDQPYSLDTANIPEFRNTNGSCQSLMEYLEDGFEVPYWNIIIDAFSTFRSHEITLGGNLVATALIRKRSNIYASRRQLQKTLDSTPGEGDLCSILVAIDKRIKILHDFADCAVDGGADCDDIFDSLMAGTTVPLGEPDMVVTADIISISAARNEEPSSASEPLLLITLVLLTLIAATVPFALGFKASDEVGSVSDADFWFNASSSIFTIMTNFVMIVQLAGGSRFSAQYAHTWIWFSVGVLCAIVSVAIYPFCNTGWSSLLSFSATVAGFGATLSVALAVGGSRCDGRAGGEGKKTKME